MAAPVVVRVGCALDNSVERAFGDLEKRANRAGAQVRAAMVGASRSQRQVGNEARTAAKEVGSSERRVTAETLGEASKRLSVWRSMGRQRVRDNETFLRQIGASDARAWRQRASNAVIESRRASREQARASRELDRFATRTSHRATRFLMPNWALAGVARRTGADIMRGIGVDTTIAGAIGRGRELQTAATQLSTAGFISGQEGPAGRRVDVRTLQAEARTTAEKFSIDPQSVIEAQGEFVKLTGDLDVARKMMGELSGMSIASGASMQDMATAAGELSNALGDVGTPEEKIKAISATLRQLAAQGKIGSVEIRDYARYMAHLGGTVSAFGGDRAQRLAQFGALTQLAKSYGGGTSAAVATRAVSGFRNILETPARRAQFKKYGVQIEDEKGMLRDPFEIIKDAIRKTGGETEPIKEMFANVIGARAVTGLTGIYKQAGRGESGMAAIDAALKKQMEASSMTDEAIAEAVSKYEDTTAAKAQKFQANLDKVAEAAANKLLPTLEKLAPRALQVAEALGKLAEWVATNPWKAIGLAITASIARAGIESAFRAAIERAIVGVAAGTAPGSKMGGAAFMPAGGALGALTAGLTISAAAVTLYVTGTMIIDQLLDAMAAKQGKEIMSDVQDFDFVQRMKRKMREQRGVRTTEEGELTEEDKKKLRGELSEREKQRLARIEKDKTDRIAKAEEDRKLREAQGLGAEGPAWWQVGGGPGGMTGSPLGGGPLVEAGGVVGDPKADEQMATMREELGAVRELLKGPLTVNVANVADLNASWGPPPNNNGREPLEWG